MSLPKYALKFKASSNASWTTSLKHTFGLPLSDTKLNLTAFSPVIARADKHLAASQNQFLNAKGRSVLINSVIDGASAYLMAANQFPKGVLDTLDSCRKAFLWDGTSKTIGSHCLVACLHGHTKLQSISVREICDGGISTSLVPRRTQQAATELLQVEEIVSSIQLSQLLDEQQCLCWLTPEPNGCALASCTTQSRTVAKHPKLGIRLAQPHATESPVLLLSFNPGMHQMPS